MAKTKKEYGDELLRIHREYGQLTVSNVIQKAEDESSPLHDAFEWDDERAGAEYRKQQARALIRSVRVLWSKNGKTNVEVHAFYHVPPEDGNGEGAYQTRDVIIENVDMFTRALGELERDLSSAQDAVAEMQLMAPRGKRRKISKLGKTINQAQEQAHQLTATQ